MGRLAATAVHLTLSVVAIALYVLFVLPRWWELMGDTSHTLGTVLRVVTGVLFAAAAIPIVLTLLRTKKPELDTPPLALNLRLSAAIAHVMAGTLILGTAIAEIWVSFTTAGAWLAGVYGVAAALAILGMSGFHLAFIADQAPTPPKAKKAAKQADEEPDSAEADSDGAEQAEVDDEKTTVGAEPDEKTTVGAEPDEKTTVGAEPDEKPTDELTTVGAQPDNEKTVEVSDSVSESDSPAKDESSALRNKRPSGKSGHRLRRRERTNVTVEE